jgi:DNA-binding HxlR family transcriptional regulator
MSRNNVAVCMETIKQTMDIFGGKWTILIIGSLYSGAKRFNQMSKDLGINTKSLTDALKSLESNGIIIRSVFPTTPVTVEYSLTDSGRDFGQVFLAMNTWGEKWLKNSI